MKWLYSKRNRQIINKAVYGVLYPLLTVPMGAVLYRQRTRQASVFRDTLKLGGFLFSGGAS